MTHITDRSDYEKEIVEPIEGDRSVTIKELRTRTENSLTP